MHNGTCSKCGRIGPIIGPRSYAPHLCDACFFAKNRLKPTYEWVPNSTDPEKLSAWNLKVDGKETPYTIGFWMVGYLSSAARFLVYRAKENAPQPKRALDPAPLRNLLAGESPEAYSKALQGDHLLAADLRSMGLSERLIKRLEKLRK